MLCGTSPHTNPAVIVGLNVGGLGLIRTLAREYIRCIGVDATFSTPGAKTRLCAKVKSPSIEDSRLIETLLSIAENSPEKPVLYLCEDVAVMVVAEHYDTLKDVFFLNFPEPDTVRTFMDKKLFSEYAREFHFRAPAFYSASCDDDIARVASQVTYPCILKPAIRTASYNENAPSKAYQAFSEPELKSLYRTISPWAREVVIQEWIPGPDDAIYFSLMYFSADARCLAALGGRKLRQWHPKTGTGSLVESVNNDTVRTESDRLFTSTRYRGMGSVEFKLDPRDNQFKLIEATVGRADWLSYLSVASGINIPYIYYCDMVYGTKPALQRPQWGVKWMVDDNDVKASLYYLLRGEISLKSWRESLKGVKNFAYFDGRDIGPFIFLLLELSLKFVLNFFGFFGKLKKVNARLAGERETREVD